MAEQIGKGSVADLRNGFILPLSSAAGYQGKGQSKVCRPISNASRSLKKTAHPSMLSAERVQPKGRVADEDPELKQLKDVISLLDQPKETSIVEFLAEMGLRIVRVADGDHVIKEPKDIIPSMDQLEETANEISNAMLPAEMGQPIGNGSVVFGGVYVLPEELVLTFDKRGNGNFVVKDQDNTISLLVRPRGNAWHEKREVVDDASGRVIAMLRDKIITTHKKWIAKGKGPDGKYTVAFSAKKEYMFQSNTSVNVCLGDEMSSSGGSDYQFIGKLEDKNGHIYVLGSSVAIAQICEGASPGQLLVRINPGVDYLFVVALIVIVDAIESLRTTNSVFVEAAKQVLRVAVAVGIQVACGAVL